MSIELLYDNTEITPIVQNINWQGDSQEPFRTLTTTVTNTKDRKERLINFEEGKEITFKWEDEEVFRGVLFEVNRNKTGENTLTVFDENIYLTKNYDTRREENFKASSLVRKLCNEFGISIGDIEDTGYRIPKKIYQNKTLWDMIKDALEITKKQTGKVYVVFNEGGKLYLKERKNRAVAIVLNDANIIDASYVTNIEELRNQIKVVAGDPEKEINSETVSNQELINKFGRMQHLEEADEDKTNSQLKQLANQLLDDKGTIDDDADLTALGDVRVTSKKSIYVIEKMTGIIGGYYVDSDRHTFTGQNYDMSLTLKADENLPKLKKEAG